MYRLLMIILWSMAHGRRIATYPDHHDHIGATNSDAKVQIQKRKPPASKGNRSSWPGKDTAMLKPRTAIATMLLSSMPSLALPTSRGPASVVAKSGVRFARPVISMQHPHIRQMEKMERTRDESMETFMSPHEIPMHQGNSFMLWRQPRQLTPTSRLTQPMLPPLEHGKRLQLVEDVSAARFVAGRDQTGTKIWRSAALLCEWLRDFASNDLLGTSVLELGAGTGAVGLFSASLGPSKVLITDGSPECCEMVRTNTDLNSADLSASVEVQELLFGASNPPAGYSWIIGSDITYNSGHRVLDDLCLLIKTLLVQSDGSARCILAHEHRRGARTWAKMQVTSRYLDSLSRVDKDALMTWDEGDKVLQDFLSLAEKHGLVVVPLLTQRGASISDIDHTSGADDDISIVEVSLQP